MANNDFYTMTPGSGVADALHEILTRRKAEARQAMLDQLSRQEQESTIDYRNRSLKSQDEARQDQIWQRRTALHGGDPVSGLSPQEIQEGQSGGWLTQDQPQTGAAPQTPSTSPAYHWADTSETRKRREDKNTETQEQAALDQMLQDPSLSAQERKALTMVRNVPEARRTLLSTLVSRQMTPPTKDKPHALLLPSNKYRYADANGQTVTADTLPAGYEDDRGFEPPSANGNGQGGAAANTPQRYELADPDGEKGSDGKVITRVVIATPNELAGHMNDKNWVKTHTYMGGDLTRNNVPVPVKPTSYTPNTAQISNLRQALNAVQTSGQGVHVFGNPANDTAKQTLTNARAPIISMLPTPALQQEARNLLLALDDNTPNAAGQTPAQRVANATIEQIVGGLKARRPMSPEEETAAMNIFPYLLGRF